MQVSSVIEKHATRDATVPHWHFRLARRRSLGDGHWGLLLPFPYPQSHNALQYSVLDTWSCWPVRRLIRFDAEEPAEPCPHCNSHLCCCLCLNPLQVSRRYLSHWKPVRFGITLNFFSITNIVYFQEENYHST